MQDRFDFLTRQRDREHSARVSPSNHQHRNSAPSLWKINFNLAEVSFGTLTSFDGNRQKSLSLTSALLLDIASDSIVATNKSVFAFQSIKDSLGRMALLLGSRLIRSKDLINDLLKRLSQLTAGPRLREGIRFGHWFMDHLPDLVPGVSQRASDLPDAHAIAMSQPNSSVIIHLEHPPARLPARKNLAV